MTSDSTCDFGYYLEKTKRTDKESVCRARECGSLSTEGSKNSGGTDNGGVNSGGSSSGGANIGGTNSGGPNSEGVSSGGRIEEVQIEVKVQVGVEEVQVKVEKVQVDCVVEVHLLEKNVASLC